MSNSKEDTEERICHIFSWESKKTTSNRGHCTQSSLYILVQKFRIPSILKCNIEKQNSRGTKTMGVILMHYIDLFRPIQTYLQ